MRAHGSGAIHSPPLAQSLERKFSLSHRDAVAVRGDPVLPKELASEVALIAEASACGNVRKLMAGSDQALRQLESMLNDIRVRRHAELLHESTEELVASHAGLAGEFGE